jgi:hypothetical protein
VSAPKPAYEVIVHDGDRVFFILSNREFEVVPAPILVESLGAERAAEATADVLRNALNRAIPDVASTGPQRAVYRIVCADGSDHLHEVKGTPLVHAEERHLSHVAGYMDQSRPETLWDCGPHSVAAKPDFPAATP